jgi:glycosyltransferase involved in cell wall biosynthesis
MKCKKPVIVCWNPAISGGKIAATGYAEVLNADIIYLNPQRFKLLNSLALIKSFVNVISYRHRNVYIVEGREVSFMFFVLSLFFKINYITRIGRIYSTRRKKLFWMLPHLRAKKIIAPSEIALNQAFLSFARKKCLQKSHVIANPIILHSENKLENYDVSKHFLIVARNIPDKRINQAIIFAQRINELCQIPTKLITTNCHEFSHLKYISTYEFGTQKIEPFFKNCMALINFAQNEGFSLISFEAACYGVPTISLAGLSAQNEYINKGVLPGQIINSPCTENAKLILETISSLRSQKINSVKFNSSLKNQLLKVCC